MLTFVFQGPLLISTRQNIEKTKKNYPQSKIVLSTYTTPDFNDCYDRLIIVSDPGSQPSYRKNSGANNINRQLATARSGLAAVETPYAVKIRTDCYMAESGLLDVYLESNPDDISRLLAISYFTLHPSSIEGLTFHISDWFLFGRTESLRQYFDADPQNNVDATWYSHQNHPETANRFDRKYQSRFSPEQYLSVNYAKKKKYLVPRWIGDNSELLRKSYGSFLANEFIIVEPGSIGLRSDMLDKYHKSNFNRLNCVSYRDWMEISYDVNRGVINKTRRRDETRDQHSEIKIRQRLWCGKILRSNHYAVRFLFESKVYGIRGTPILVSMISYFLKLQFYCFQAFRILSHNFRVKNNTM
jgi:hypothetical protein